MRKIEANLRCEHRQNVPNDDVLLSATRDDAKEEKMTLAYFEARGLLLTVLESRTWVVELKETQHNC